jgi:dihydroflavonol-4-reductase
MGHGRNPQEAAIVPEACPDMSNSAFVTGASGFVGGHLLQQLVEQGWQVTALVRGASVPHAPGQASVRFVQGDVLDRESLRKAIPARVSAVFHVAANTSIWAREQAVQTAVNVDGTANLIAAASAAGAGRLVHTSSFVVWGFQDDIFNEDSPRNSKHDWINYLRSKQAAEQLVKQAVADGRLDAVICNPAHILGPGDRHNWSRMIRLVHQQRLPGIPPGGGVFADVREVARAHLAAFHHGRSGQNYLLGGEAASFHDLIQALGGLLQRKVPARATPAWAMALAGRFAAAAAVVTGRAPDITPEGAALTSHTLRCDSSRAIAELAYRYTGLDTLLGDTCNWMRSEGLLT